MLAGKIANLASLWVGSITGRHFAANVWVNVGTSGNAVSAWGNGHRVDVVYYTISQLIPWPPFG